MMKAVLLTALVMGAAGTGLPIYCRLLQKGMEMATFNPIIADTNVSMTSHAKGFGNISVSVSHLEIASAKVVDCDASIDEEGNFNVGVGRLDLALQQLDWAYKQQSFPHLWDHGSAKGVTSISFNVSIDTNTQKASFLKLNLGNIDFDMGAQHHKWLTEAVMKLTKFMRPIISDVVHYEAKKTLGASLELIHEKGGCAFLQNVLKGADMTKIIFTDDNNTVHVPVVGDVQMSVDSKWVSQPTSMDCKHVGFSGSKMVARVDNVPFSAGFAWAYEKQGSKIWHNHGNGSTSIVAGADFHIDLLDPESTVLKIELPVLKLSLHAEAHAWMYDALTGVMVPLVRESFQVFCGKLLTDYLKECLKDPTCPHLHPEATPAPPKELIVV